MAHILKCAVHCSAVLTSTVLGVIGSDNNLAFIMQLFVEIQNTCLWLESCLHLPSQYIFPRSLGGEHSVPGFVEWMNSKQPAHFGQSLWPRDSCCQWNLALEGKGKFLWQISLTNQRESWFKRLERKDWDVTKSNKRKKFEGQQVKKVNFKRSETRSRVRYRPGMLRAELGDWVQRRCQWYWDSSTYQMSHQGLVTSSLWIFNGHDNNTYFTEIMKRLNKLVFVELLIILVKVAWNSSSKNAEGWWRLLNIGFQ